MTMDRGRFDEIMAVVHANLVDEFQKLAEPCFEVVPESDVSDYLPGGVACLLAGANVAWSDMEEFADKFTARFKTGDVSPAATKAQTDADARIQREIPRF